MEIMEIVHQPWIIHPDGLVHFLLHVRMWESLKNLIKNSLISSILVTHLIFCLEQKQIYLSIHHFTHFTTMYGKLGNYNSSMFCISSQSSIVRTLDLFITLMETLLENHIWYEFIFEQVDLNLNSVSISIISVTVRWMKPMSNVIFTISASKLNNLIFSVAVAT